MAKKSQHGSALLLAWIGERQQGGVADLLGVLPSHLNHWLRRRRNPGLMHAVAIEDLTEGAVPVRSWVD